MAYEFIVYNLNISKGQYLMSETFNILVTDGNYKHTLGIARLLGKHDYKVYVLNNSKRSLSGASRYVENTLVTCDWNEQENEEQYISQVKDYSLSYNIDLIIPVGFKNCMIISKYKKELTGICDVVIPDLEKIEFAMDKSKVLMLANELGVGIPSTYYPESLEEVNIISREITYPCVIKSRFEHGNQVVTYPQNAKELNSMYKEIIEKHSFDNYSFPMIQEYVAGDGYAFFALYINGSCKQIFMHHRLREFPVTGGASVKAEAFYDEELLLSGKRILDKLKWHGVAMVEFKKDINGIYKLMEINPKYWGSTDLALSSGALFPLLTAEHAAGIELDYCDTFDQNIKFHWPCDGDWLHALHNPKNFLNVLIDCFDPRVKSNWWWRDYRVNFLLLRNLLAGIYKFLIGK